MATSMKLLVNVTGTGRCRFINIYRCLVLKKQCGNANETCQKRRASQNIRNSNDSPDNQQNTEREDFFGIPEDFKLRHVRHHCKKTQTYEEGVSNNEVSMDSMSNFETPSQAHYNKKEDEGEIVKYGRPTYYSSRSKRRERRAQIHQAVFSTTFGTISFDQNQEASADSLERKAQEILSRQQSVATKVKFDSVPKMEHPMAKADTTSLSSGKANFFDEAFFSNLDDVAHYSKQLSESSNSDDVRYASQGSLKPQTKSMPTNTSSQEKSRDSSSRRPQPLPPSTNIIDEQYFGTVANTTDETKPFSTSKISNSSQTSNTSFIDEQYFDSNFTSTERNVDLTNHENFVEEYAEIDEQYFGDTFQDLNAASNTSSRTDTEGRLNSVHQEHLAFSGLQDVVKEYTYQPDVSPSRKEFNRLLNEDKLAVGLMQEADEEKSVSDGEDQSDEQDEKRSKQPNIDNPVTAYDLAMRIRQDLKYGARNDEQPLWKQQLNVIKQKSHTGDEKVNVRDSNRKLDSKGYRILEDQIPDLDTMTSADIVRMLKSKIIFDHEDFLAIDKPYGLPSLGQKHDRVSLTELLPSLVAILPKSFATSALHLVQGMDRDVTGAVILAKNPEVAAILRGMYDNPEEVIQRYWAVTKGVPNPHAGIIDIPVGESKIGNIYKMVLRPRFYKDEKLLGKASKAPSRKAVTEYTVLSSHLQSALVECSLLTNNVRHQLRVHLASGLNTPILGDHKYSNFAKLAPQKLHKEMLDLLKIRQAKVRHLALHLHCRSVVFTNYKGRMIFLTTRPPQHFRENMKSLNLRSPKQ